MDCEYVKASYRIVSVPYFAAMWCDIPERDIEFVLSNATTTGDTARGSILLESRDYQCLKPRISFMLEAYDKKELELCDEKGDFREGIASSRLCIRFDKAREWLKRCCLPQHELPKFIFPEIEHKELEQKKLIEDQKSRIEALESALETKTFENIALNKQINDLRIAKDSAENNLKNKDHEIAALKKQIGCLKENYVDIDEDSVVYWYIEQKRQKVSNAEIAQILYEKGFEQGPIGLLFFGKFNDPQKSNTLQRKVRALIAEKKNENNLSLLNES